MGTACHNKNMNTPSKKDQACTLWRVREVLARLASVFVFQPGDLINCHVKTIVNIAHCFVSVR